MTLTIETAIARLTERVSTGCLGGDDDSRAVEILLADYARVIEAKNLQVEIVRELEEK